MYPLQMAFNSFCLVEPDTADTAEPQFNVMLYRRANNARAKLAMMYCAYQGNDDKAEREMELRNCTVYVQVGM